MAFALTKVEAFGYYRDEVVTKRVAVQVLDLYITAANTDVALDLSNNTGTFFTAVGGTAPGAACLQAIKDIAVRANFLKALQSEALLTRQAVGGLSVITGTYGVAVSGKRPDISFFSTNAPTAYTLRVEWELKDGEQPVVVKSP